MSMTPSYIGWLSMITGFSFGGCCSHGVEIFCFHEMQMFITDHKSLQLSCAEIFQFSLHHHTLISYSPFLYYPLFCTTFLKWYITWHFPTKHKSRPSRVRMSFWTSWPLKMGPICHTTTPWWKPEISHSVL